MRGVDAYESVFALLSELRIQNALSKRNEAEKLSVQALLTMFSWSLSQVPQSGAGIFPEVHVSHIH